jgi:hypothetical protein
MQNTENAVKKLVFAAVLAAIVSLMLVLSCTVRVETGTVGLRINFNNELEPIELLPGSWNQKIVGNIIVFPVKEVAGYARNRHD